MGKIVAIGGSEIRNSETSAIDREVVTLTAKPRPRALFIPTASYDSLDYWTAFQTIYGEELGCETSVIYLLDNHPPMKQIEEMILSSDLIYVGGGNTLKMMRRWRKLGVDQMLKEAYARDIVLSGVSAGAICWFNYGHSDSMAFYHPDTWSYIRVRGLGLIDVVGCPHFDSETAGKKRDQDFREMVQKYGGTGIGIDNNCALEFTGEGFRVISSQPAAGAYKLFRDRGQVTVEQIQHSQDYLPVSSLLATVSRAS